MTPRVVPILIVVEVPVKRVTMHSVDTKSLEVSQVNESAVLPPGNCSLTSLWMSVLIVRLGTSK